MWLTLDIGNSAAKGGLYEGDTLQQVFHVELARADSTAAWEQALRRELDGANVERIGVASVVPSVTPGACEALERLTGTSAERLHVDMHLPFKLNYATPETLGIDRLAAAVAAWLRYGHCDDPSAARSVVAIDAGTAVTLEVITRTGAYEGGTIGPGPALLRRSLREGTAQLPDVPLEAPDHVIGRSTQEALQIGIVGGFIESVRGLLDRIRESLDDVPVVVVTGGWSALLAQRIDAIDHVAPHLVLDGIRALMQINPR